MIIYSTSFVCSNQNIPPPLSPWTIICFLVIFLLVVDSSVFFQLMVSDSTTLLSFVVCRRVHFLFTLFVFACAKCCPTHLHYLCLLAQSVVQHIIYYQP